MFDLFGSELPLAARFFIAFLVVLALIGLVAWLVRRFGSGKLNTAARGRQPRLAVIDAAAVDARRRLVLIRRDNIEHLLMIGGPTDLVVEPNIVRAVASREAARESARSEPTVPRPAPAIESSSPLQPSSEPLLAAPPQRAYRSPTTGEPWHSPEPGARIRPADSLTGLAAELSTRLTAPESLPPLRQESAPPRASATAELQPDHNLAEMAQQLEAALRRAPVTDPLAVPATAGNVAPRAYAEPKLEAKVEPKFEPKLEPRIEPKLELKIEAKSDEPKPEAKFETKFEPKSQAKPEPAPTSGKTFYDNLEEEMASLLGRPSGKS